MGMRRLGLWYNGGMKTVMFSLAVFLGGMSAFGSVHVPLAVRPGNNMHLADGTVEGVPCRLLVDTGATHTTFDLGFVTNRLPKVELQDVQLLGTTNVRTPPRFFPYKAFKLGEHAFASEGAMAIPLDMLAPSVGERVDGILGMSDLSSGDFILRDDELIFEPTDAERRGFGPDVRKGGDMTRPCVAGRHEGREIPFLVDSGSSFTFVKEGFWKPSTNAVSLSATEVSGRTGIRPRVGEQGVLDLGIPLILAPMISNHEPNYLGADLLKRYDILFLSSGRAIAFRPRLWASALTNY